MTSSKRVADKSVIITRGKGIENDDFFLKGGKGLSRNLESAARRRRSQRLALHGAGARDRSRGPSAAWAPPRASPSRKTERATAKHTGLMTEEEGLKPPPVARGRDGCLVPASGGTVWPSAAPGRARPPFRAARLASPLISHPLGQGWPVLGDTQRLPQPKNRSQTSHAFDQTSIPSRFPKLHTGEGGRALGRPGRPRSARAAGSPRTHVLELLRDGRNLLHPVLVSRQVALEGLVLPQQGPHLRQRRRLVVLLQQDLLFACKVGARGDCSGAARRPLCARPVLGGGSPREGGGRTGPNTRGRRCDWLRLSLC